MNALISNPADCEVRDMIRFLQAENVRPCEIHQRLVAVYGEHVMNAASIRKWCIMFTNGRTDVHDTEKSGRPSVITDALKEKVLTVRLTYLAQSVRIKPNFQGLPWSEFDGLGNDDLITLVFDLLIVWTIFCFYF